MYGLTRGLMTLIGVAIAGGLIWLASWIDPRDSVAEYWYAMALVAGAGLVMALSQLLGGWTKWGLPAISPNVFLFGFVPAAIAGGWLLTAAQPSDNEARTRVLDWSADLGISGIVGDLTTLVGAIAFGLGLVFGLVFDTSGTYRRGEVDYDTRVADEPTAAERAAAAEADPHVVPAGREGQPVGVGTGYDTTPDGETTTTTPRRRLFRR